MREQMVAIDPSMSFEERRRDRYMRRSVRAAKEEAAECAAFFIALGLVCGAGIMACRLMAMVLIAAA